MTWVKICGLSRLADLHAAEEAGADAIGVVLAESPRQVDEARAAELIAATRLPAYLVTVGLAPGAVVGLLERTGGHGLQPHGSDAEAAAAVALDHGAGVLFPLVGSGKIAWERVPDGARPLVDGPVPGSGRPVDWEPLRAAPAPFVLAGGLDPENVRDAIVASGAAGVDVSSGVESAPGRKDPDRIRSFVERAKTP